MAEVELNVDRGRLRKWCNVLVKGEKKKEWINEATQEYLHG